jgi:general secretion pathway protein L
MLTETYRWWKEQMRDLVPASFRRFGRRWRPELVVAAASNDATEVELSLQGRGGQTSLGRHTLGSDLQHAVNRVPKALRRTAVLQVPAGGLLERQVTLPLSAELDLRRVVAHEMDRLTPFRADEVMWDCTIERRDTGLERIHVRVTMVPLARVQPLLASLRQAGVRPVRVQAVSFGQLRAIPMVDNRQRRTLAGLSAWAWLQGGCGVLAATAVALPFILQAVARDDVETRIAAMRPQVAEAEQLRKVIASGTATADVIAAARGQAGSALHSVALLTEMLPDDTYLTLMSVNRRKLSITGRSASAARLIGALAANPLLRNPAFTAPVLRDEANRGEMFSINVEVGS